MAVRDDFTAGEVLAAADLNDTFASKVDYALPVNAQTGTTYTFVAADAEKLTTASNAAAVTLTIPPQSSVTWSDNTVLRVVNYGAGAVTIDGGSGVTVTNTASTIAQYGAAVAIRTGSDAWTVVPFGGGDIPAATVSSPAATGQYTDTGITYDYYTFTASGTLTVDTAGFADVLVVGGGAGGSRGGGGAGGMLVASNAYLESGSLSVTVGAGGAGVSSVEQASFGVTSRLGNLFGFGGGGGYLADGVGFAGGSGGGGRDAGRAGGAGVAGQGNDGGDGGGGDAGGGGGGAGAAGNNAGTNAGGNGGNGLANTFTGTSVTYAGGGGGGDDGGTAGTGGTGGGGAGSSTGNGTAGTANTGGGGGGADSGFTGGNGGSGIVIVRVKV